MQSPGDDDDDNLLIYINPLGVINHIAICVFSTGTMRSVLISSIIVLLVEAEDPYTRAVRLVSQMSLTEKLGFVQQNRTQHPDSGYVGIISGVPRLGIPDMRMNDGPEGFRGPPGTSTQWPSGLTVAHSFDRDLFALYGAAIGEEVKFCGFVDLFFRLVEF